MALLLNPRVWLALVLAGFLAFTHFSTWRAGRAAVRTQFDAYKTEQAVLTQKAEADARTREQALQEQANQIGATKDEQILAIGSRLDAALAGLRNRPARPVGDVSKAAGACKGATGAELFRSDGEFLARLAARADGIAAERDACYRQYEALRR